MRLGKNILSACVLIGLSVTATADPIKQTKGSFEDKFRQLEEDLPTPGVTRTGSGAPGHQYWQQKVDYRINVTIDEEKRRLTGDETVTYTNNAPDTLRYLWLQMDQNRFSQHSDAYEAIDRGADAKDSMSYAALREAMLHRSAEWGFQLAEVSIDGEDAAYAINDTMMRLDLPTPLAPGESVTFRIRWSHLIPEARQIGARGGYEQYARHGNDIYFMAQWFPRLAAYTDLQGWENKQFLGTGEFTLEFGDYDVSITVPADHIVGSTGVLQNPKQVLTADQQRRLSDARTAERPVMIVTRDEALANEAERTSRTKTWRFVAEDVRDFAFASSRKFVWDAMGVKMPGSERVVMAMSLYPEEAMPLWDKYSTHAIAHTLDTYSRYSVEYPYPVAWSVKGPIGGGMEYPMITSNGPMPTDVDFDNRTYSKRAKYGLISVIIHEIGHIYFPMVINTDERNWAWMDEGINSFLQSRAEREWEAYYPSRYGHPDRAIPYMLGNRQTPIMTQSDTVLGYFPNAYTKTAVALNILRETVVGPELFDFAFREYSRRWAFKRPYPADFFRSIEDATAQDLDWFWRGWFYSTDHVDIAITGVTQAKVNTRNPDVEQPIAREKYQKERRYIGEDRARAEGRPLRVDRFPELRDFYNDNDDYLVTGKQRGDFQDLVAGLKDWERELLTLGEELTFIDFENIGGLVMPLVLSLTFEDGSTEEVRIGAEIWRQNPKKITKLLIREKKIVSVTLDPHNELADADKTNNNWPRKMEQSRVELFKRSPSRNLMREARDSSQPDQPQPE